MNMNETNGVRDIIETARAGAAIKDRIAEVRGIPVGFNGAHFAVLSDVQAEADRRAPGPQRRRGTATFTELQSFIAHVNRFKDPHSLIFADAAAVRLIAVLNYHPGGSEGARWNDHRSVYTCPLSEPWKLWTKNDGVEMTQDAFADFLEANERDIAGPRGAPGDDGMPQPAAVLDLARNLVIHSRGEFQRTINPTTGEATLICKEEHEKSSTRIPKAFLLGIQVFEEGEYYRVEARIRFRMDEGRPRFSYILYQPQLAVRDAFHAVRVRAKGETVLDVLAGTPEVQ